MPKSVKKYIIEDDVYEYNKTNIEKFLDIEMSKTTRNVIIDCVVFVVLVIFCGSYFKYCDKNNTCSDISGIFEFLLISIKAICKFIFGIGSFLG